jgi:uncharacterized protein
MLQTDYGRAVELEAKALTEDDECWTFTGYASIFSTKDQGGDIVSPVGTITEAEERKRGLWVKGELPKDDTRVSGWLVPQLKRRGLKGMSIGYRTIESEKRKSDGARLLKQVRLYECSFVSMPMHLDAGLESLKGITPYEVANELEEFKAVLREFNELLDPVARAEAAMLRALEALERMRDER